MGMDSEDMGPVGARLRPAWVVRVSRRERWMVRCGWQVSAPPGTMDR